MRIICLAEFAMNDLWLFIEHGTGTWTRALIPSGVQSVMDLIRYLQRGGQVVSQWVDLPERAKYQPRNAGFTVIARLL